MAKNLVTNADDVDLYVDFSPATSDEDGETTAYRLIAQDFTITVDQTINSISGISQNVPKGLTKGDIEYTFSFSVQGQDTKVMENVSDDDGDSTVFDMNATKTDDNGNIEWEYSLTTCLADTEEVSGSTDEAMELSVEGMAAGFDKETEQ